MVINSSIEQKTFEGGSYKLRGANLVLNKLWPNFSISNNKNRQILTKYECPMIAQGKKHLLKTHTVEGLRGIHTLRVWIPFWGFEGAKPLTSVERTEPFLGIKGANPYTGVQGAEPLDAQKSLNSNNI